MMTKTTEIHHISQGIRTASCGGIITLYNIISLLYPRQLLQYITTGWLAGIGIGEKEFMSLSFPQIVRIQEPGQQHIGFLVAALQLKQIIVKPKSKVQKSKS